MDLVRAEQKILESFVQLALFSAVFRFVRGAEQRITESVAQLCKTREMPSLFAFRKNQASAYLRFA